MGEPTDVIAALNAKVARLEHDLAEALTDQAQKIADGIAAGMAEVQSIVDVCREQDAEHGRVVGENHRLSQQATRLAGFVKGHVPEDLEGDTERAVRWLTQYVARLEGERDRLDRAYEEAASALMAAREKQGLAKAKLTYQRQDFDRTLHEVMQAASTVIGRMEHELSVHYNAQCPNLSYYGRRCIQAPHSPAASCIFAPNEDSEWYDLQNGSTMAELLEALTAGGPIAVSAAMRWLEYRLHSDHADAVRTFGDHIVTQVKATALGIVQEEQKQVLRYLSERATKPTEEEK